MASRLVYNIEPASPMMIASLDRHCLNRTPDGTSNIVARRTPLNRVLVGDKRGLMASMRKFYATGVKRPARQSERPYLRIVASASPTYFRPDDPGAVGTWDEGRLTEWLDATMGMMKAEHGDDLVFAHLHLDEDTPHVHAVVAPTYSKKARKPGRKKRGETDEEFEARKKAALEGEGVRAVGRASHPTLSKKGSFQRLRERMAIAVNHLGIDYGEDRAVTAPPGMSTRKWVEQLAAKNQAQQAQNAKETEALAKERAKLAEEKAAFAVEKKAHAAEMVRERKDIDMEWVGIEAEWEDAEATEAKLQQGWKELETAKQQHAVEVEKTGKLIETGVQNLQVAMNLAVKGEHDTEILAEDMPETAKRFAVLKDAAPGNRPTRGFQAKFWSLNYPDGSGPTPLPERIRKSLTKGFDRVAIWASELRTARAQAASTVADAEKVAEQVLSKAEDGAARIIEEARERGDERASRDVGIRSYNALLDLMKRKIRDVFGNEGYNRLAKEVNEEWANHPDNAYRPLIQAERAKSSLSESPNL